MTDNFQYELLEEVLDYDKKDDEHILKLISSTN